MKLKLVNYTTNIIENVTFGTCELCMYTSSMTENYFHFEDEKGKIHKVEGFAWSWGDLMTIYVENIPHFASWVSQQDFPQEEDLKYGYDYDWLNDIVNDYHDDQEEQNMLDFMKNHTSRNGNTVTFHFKEEINNDSIMHECIDYIVGKAYPDILDSDNGEYFSSLNEDNEFTIKDSHYYTISFGKKYDIIENTSQPYINIAGFEKENVRYCGEKNITISNNSNVSFTFNGMNFPHIEIDGKD